MTIAKFRIPRASLLKKKDYDVDQTIVNTVINKVSQVCNINPSVITKKGRYRDNVLARNMCYYILHVHYKQKSAQIAPYFNRDRTTVLHGINTCLNDLDVVPFYMEKYKVVRSMIRIPKIYSETK